ncbi:MAG: phosphoenolpyruvate--protein phosphotransferase [Actinobacteria bacterium]|nr:phosphoenolpyruvate--protein phosphotransferase [Actinomycetota bacterium]
MRERATVVSKLTGTGVGRGVAAGPVLRMPDPLQEPLDAVRTADATSEVSRANEALAAVGVWLGQHAVKVGGDAQAVLEAQALMAGDPAIAKDVSQRIHGGKTAERAVFEAFGAFQTVFEGMGGYMGERSADLADVSRRVIAHLRGVAAPGVPDSEIPFILVADNLAPADTAMLDFNRVLGLITRDGGPTSHTAILARAKSIPAIVGVHGAENLRNGTLVILDASTSTVTVDASPHDISEANVRRSAWLAASNAPITAGALKDGHEIALFANLGSPKEAAEALRLGAEGVGLFRTELLFLDSTTAPTVEAQEKHYVELLSAFADKKVVVRVLDAGADKPLAFLNDGHEDNPALGLRGLRALRVKESILRDQIQALVNAQNKTDAELWVMAPMVSDAEETDYFVGLAKEMGLRVAGVMAEVPALALVADQVFASADFVSIGTNDLTQYTMAADRMLGSVASYQDPWHPAMLRLIERLGAAGADAGKPVGVCGEAAADPDLAIVLVGLGVTTLSMAPAALAEVRAALLTVTLEEAQNRAARALTGRTAAESRQLGSH